MNKHSRVEIFNNYEKRTISTPLSFLDCDNDQLREDVLKNLHVDLCHKDSFSYRYVVTRLFWFLLIHYANESEYPKLHKFLSKITNQTLLVNIRSLAENDVEMYYPNEEDAPKVHEWYDLLKHRIVSNQTSEMCLPDTVEGAANALNIKYHMDRFENSIDESFIDDENILITLRGLYNAASSYISVGIIIPLSAEYVEYIDGHIDTDVKDALTCYIQYDSETLQNYIEKHKTIVTSSRKYRIHYPVSVSYNTMVDTEVRGLCNISFNTSVPYKQLEVIEKDASYRTKDIELTCFSVNSLCDLYENVNAMVYDVTIKTSNPEQVMNYLKIRDILPELVYITPVDIINDKFYTMIEKIKSHSIE